MVAATPPARAAARPRIAFFGTPEFALSGLERLVAEGHRVVVAVTQPDRPRGRGHRTEEPPVKRGARAHRIPVLQPGRLRDPAFLAALEAHAPEIGVVVAYGKILPESLLRLPRLGMINVHASLLPRYRGAAPVHRAIMAGETETGVTIMRVVSELDAGPILAARSRAIGPHETSDEAERDLARLGADLLVETLAAVAAGTVRETPQEHHQSTYAPRLTKEEGLIDWSHPARRIHDLVRGLHPWPLAYTFLVEDRLVIRRTDVHPSGADESPRLPGTVLEAGGDRLRVAAGEGDVVDILEIQAAGRRAMSARAFLAGHRIAPGAVLGAPRTR